jgi:tetratricopeptide (TPR) repeat protein
MAEKILGENVLQNTDPSIGLTEGNVINELAWEYLACEKPQQAVALLQKALPAMSGDAAFLDSLGWAYLQTGENQQGVKCLREACRLDSDWSFGEGSFEMRFHLVNGLMRIRETKASNEIIEEMKKRGKTSPWLANVERMFPELAE